MNRAVVRGLAVLALIALEPVVALGQQLDLKVTRAQGDSLSPAPLIQVVGTGVPPEFLPAFVTLELSRTADFQAPFLVRTGLAPSLEVRLDSLLPAFSSVSFRARLIDRFGTVRAERILTGTVRSWLGLVSPNRTTNVLFTRKPRFDWTSPPISTPPGPWVYSLSILNVGSGSVDIVVPGIRDTSFSLNTPLDACTSYRWSVTAALEGSPAPAITVASKGSFSIQAADCPSVTLIYQNFPNPFGAGQAALTTCFWFDLAHRSTVRLAIYDVRMRLVKELIPGRFPATIDSGAYGRANPSADEGCDDRLRWDGRDDRGRFLPTGVYIAVFEANGRRETRKMLFHAP